MDTLVLRCGGAAMPAALNGLRDIAAPAVPTDFSSLPPADTAFRIIVLGSDAALAAVLTWLLRTERLHQTEVGFVTASGSRAARIWQLGSGERAARRAREAPAQAVPLIRDDTGTALAGYAEITGPDGLLEGEAYADDTRVFRGAVRRLRIVPVLDPPGVQAQAAGRWWRVSRWRSGRAVQLGTPAAVVVRDGVRAERIVKRASFYRHHEPWLLAR